MFVNMWKEYKRLFPLRSKVPVIRVYFFGVFCRAYYERLDQLGVYNK